jgi:hypothetical protein
MVWGCGGDVEAGAIGVRRDVVVVAVAAVGLCASTGTWNPSRGAIHESVQGLSVLAGRSRECSDTAVSAILVSHG